MDASQIIYLRETLGLSQRDLARALGVAPVTVLRWESGTNQPTGLQLEVIRALHSSAMSVEGDAAKRAIAAGLVGMGIGALLFWALTQAGSAGSSAS